MKHTITPDRRQLIITVTPDEQKELREWPGDRCLTDHTPESIGSDEAMCEFLERLTCNSELDWINPADTGDLTDAPMLGILSEEGDRHYHALRKHLGLIQTGASENGPRFTSILERWAFMDYQTRSVLEDLRDKGQAVFAS